MINGGIGSELTSSGLARIDEALALNPDYRFFAITYGTNDSWGNKTDTSAFRSNLQAMIDKIKAAGRTPVLSHVPYSADGNHDTLAHVQRRRRRSDAHQPAAGRPGLHDLLHGSTPTSCRTTWFTRRPRDARR